MEVVPARELDPTAAYRTKSFIGEEGPGKGWREFFIVAYKLYIASGSQGTGSCVLLQVLGNRVL